MAGRLTPGWFMDIQSVWHLTAQQHDATIVPCLAGMFVVKDSVFYSPVLPEKGKACITCVRCWISVNMYLCEDDDDEACS